MRFMTQQRARRSFLALVPVLALAVGPPAYAGPAPVPGAAPAATPAPGAASAAAAAQTSGAPPLAWTPDAAAARATFERTTGAPLRAGFRIEPTVFPRYYALRSDVAGRPSAYFRDDMQWTANVRSAGWSMAGDAPPAPGDLQRWQREQLRAVPLERLVKVRRSTPFVAVIWSAPDCPFCRRLERSLEESGASVYVAPVGLAESGFARSAQVYCAADPGAAWRAAMGEAAATGSATASRPGCAYPRAMMTDIGFFLGRGRLATPIVVFADGSSITGWDGERAPARLKQVLAQKLYFPER